MNAERPTYERREFYGPLELSGNAPEIRHRYVLEHPDDPTKLVRTTDEGLYRDKEDMDEAVLITQQVLRSLKEHGINHVNPSYLDETSEHDEPYLFIVVDKLTAFEPYKKLIESGKLTPDQTHEADLAINRMLSFLEQAMHENSYIDIEMMHLGQFVFDPSQSDGQKMVLVDVEPVGGRKVEMEKDSMEHGIPSALAEAVAKLTADAIQLSRKTKYPVESLQKAAEIIHRLPGNSEKTIHMKEHMLHAINTRKLSREFMYFVNIDIVDDKEGFVD